ncbi:tetratricopeptide repeat protein [Shewanella cyperi]|uniref:Tetratricopeptide repeat protein n=1 Tax=Shewanella cyperi TaxID=2814292 RepID=A0A974XM53_9GAMM|nr:tetratricopeptide repeat protein [Shewanella cyperi]QSX30919.1 tetratricopeptide repeat protein [Shewanella cyperi]
MKRRPKYLWLLALLLGGAAQVRANDESLDLQWQWLSPLFEQWQQASVSVTGQGFGTLLDAHSGKTGLLSLPSESERAKGDPIQRLVLASDWFNQEQYAQALAVLDSTATDSPAARRLGALLAAHQQQWQKVLDWLPQDGTDSLGSYLRAMALLQLGQPQRAQTELASEISPVNGPLAVAQRLLQARIAAAEGQEERALSLLRTLPPDAEVQALALWTEAQILLQSDSPERARPALLRLSRREGPLQIEASAALLNLLGRDQHLALANELRQSLLQLLARQWQAQPLGKNPKSFNLVRLELLKRRTEQLKDWLATAATSSRAYARLLDKEPDALNAAVNDLRDKMAAKAQQTWLTLDRAGKQLQLEQLLTELLGQPAEQQVRYRLLVALSTWEQGQAFGHRWWQEDAPSDAVLDGAKQELESLLQMPRVYRQALVATHLQQIKLKLIASAQQAEQLEQQLTQRTVQLADELARAHQQDEQQRLAQLEPQLLRLTQELLAASPLYGATKSSSTLKLEADPAAPGPSAGRVGEQILALADPDYSQLQALLGQLGSQAQAPGLRRQAMYQEADLRLRLAEQTTELAPQSELLTGAGLLLEQLLQQQQDANLLYQLARVKDMLGDTEASLSLLGSFGSAFPAHPLWREVMFRKGEAEFSLGDYAAASASYAALESTGQDEFSDKASYKLGWSRFKNGDYPMAAASFVELLSLHWSSRGQQAQALWLEEILRISAITFSYLDGVDGLQILRRPDGSLPPFFEPLSLKLANYFLNKSRFQDAAAVYQSLLDNYPDSQRAFEFQQAKIQAYSDGKFPSLVWPEKAAACKRFGQDSIFRQQAPTELRQAMDKVLTTYRGELARYHHARAQKHNRPEDWQAAIGWYQNLLSHSGQPDAGIEYLLAEALHDSGAAVEAIDYFVKASYGAPPFDKADIASYRALQGLQTLLKQGQVKQGLLKQGPEPQLRQRLQTLAERHLTQFPHSDSAGTIGLTLAEEYFAAADHPKVLATVARLADLSLSAGQQGSALTLKAHSQFALQQYAEAEQSYEALLGKGAATEQVAMLEARLAESIFHQAETARERGEVQSALTLFRRLAKRLPHVDAAVNALFDAATLELNQGLWPDALRAFEDFASRFPNHALSATVPEKLVFLYEKTAAWNKAAAVLAGMAAKQDDKALSAAAHWQAAEDYDKANNPKAAAEQYQAFIASGAGSKPDMAEAWMRLANMTDNEAEKRQRLLQLLAMDQQGLTAQFAKAHLLLGHSFKQEAQAQLLNGDLQRAIKRRQKWMSKAVDHYSQVVSLGLAEPACEATLHMGLLYGDLAKALLSAPKPKGLNELELEQYEILLEEQVFPLEDKAIALHQLNLARIAEGLYNPWIAQSMAQLKRLLPARYARTELTEDYVEKLY